MSDPTSITIPRPHVPFGPTHKSRDEADADYLRSAAGNIRFARCLGSNLTETVCKLLNDAADAITAHDPAEVPAEVPGTAGGAL